MNKLYLLLLFALMGTAYNVYGQQHTTVAIVGGGIAGVASAYYLQTFDPNASITLFEKEASVGGNARTVEILNGQNEKCFVDMGPQYFSKGPWDEYLKFLEATIGFNTIETESVAGSLLIQQGKSAEPSLITPLGVHLRGESPGKLLKFRKFNIEAHRVHQHPEQWQGKTIRDWVVTLDFPEAYRTEIIYPFLAAGLGTDVEQIQQTSVVEIVKLFAFRKPKVSNKFYIIAEGMGSVIQRIARQLEQKGVHFKTSTVVTRVQKSGNKYVLYYRQGDKVEADTFDFVILAVHADQAGVMLQHTAGFQSICEFLAQLTYFKAQIVLHRDPRFVNTGKPAFLNIFTDTSHRLTSSTMNLSLVTPKLNGIYKSWMNPAEIAAIKSNGHFLHETTFYHPLITPGFVANLEMITHGMELFPDFVIAGGWTEGLETQNSAVMSGQKALEKYKKYKHNMTAFRIQTD